MYNGSELGITRNNNDAKSVTKKQCPAQKHINVEKNGKKTHQHVEVKNERIYKAVVRRKKFKKQYNQNNSFLQQLRDGFLLKTFFFFFLRPPLFHLNTIYSSVTCCVFIFFITFNPIKWNVVPLQKTSPLQNGLFFAIAVWLFLKPCTQFLWNNAGRALYREGKNNRCATRVLGSDLQVNKPRK